MKLSEIRVGHKYVGAGNEVREVTKMVQSHGGVVDLWWTCLGGQGKRGPLQGKSTPQLFAKWATRCLTAATNQEDGQDSD